MANKNIILYNRLKNKKVIESLFKSGCLYSTKNYKFFYLQTVKEDEVEKSEEKLLGVLFSVPKKRINKAVARNKIKRQSRNALHNALKEFPVNQYDCAVVYNSSQTNRYDKLYNEIKEFLIFLQSKNNV